MKRIALFSAWFVLFFVASTNSALSQFEQPYRFEQEVKNSEEGATVISLKKEGLAFVRDMNKFNDGKKKWQLDIVDTTLTKTWSTELELGSRLILVGYEYTPQHLYLLFREGESDFYNFQLLTIPFQEKTIQTNEVKFEVNFKMSHFTVAGTSAVFGGYVNNEPAVLLYDHSIDQTKVLPGLFINDVTLLDVRANQNQSFNILLADRKGKDRKRVIIRTYDHEGNLLIDDVINIDPQYSILSALTSSLEREELIIVGTYSEGLSKQAIGFFSVVVDPFSEQTVSYTEFTSLEHSLDYLPQRKADKIRLKARKQLALGRPSDYKAYVVPFRIEERPNGFYLLAELYYPTQSTNLYPYGSNYYNPYAYGYYPYGMSPYSSRYYNSPYMYNNPTRNADVRMMQTMVVELGPHGKVGKDASMKLVDVKLQTLEQVGDFMILKDSVFLAYKKDSEIFYQRESGDPDEKPISKQSKVKLMSENDGLKNKEENEGGTRFWYGHHFYVWGYQNIKDPTREGDQTRHVFYVNRISLEQ